MTLGLKIVENPNIAEKKQKNWHPVIDNAQPFMLKIFIYKDFSYVYEYIVRIENNSNL